MTAETNAKPNGGAASHNHELEKPVYDPAAPSAIAVDHIVLINPGTIPKTTSGKIQRNLTRQLWLDGALDVIR